MKRIYLVVVTLLICTTSQAQVGFGPEAGIQYYNIHSVPQSPYTYGSTTGGAGFKAGGVLDVNITHHVYFQTGLYYSQKGEKQEKLSYQSSDTSYEYVNQKLNISYLELPATVLVKTGTQGETRFVLGLGLDLSYALGGKINLLDSGYANQKPYAIRDNGNISVGADVSTFDLGMNFIMGCEFGNGLFVRAYYTLGVTDISGSSADVEKNRVLGLSVGYFFGKGRDIDKEKDDLIEK